MSQASFQFSVQHRDKNGRARAGLIRTAHSEIKTPVFMPVGTHAVIRGHDTQTLLDMGFQIILGNTYHLLLRPGPDIFRQFGGIHQFMKWDRSVLTDSGGFQLFSLSRGLKISPQGAEFRSYVDGKTVLLTPESSIETQCAINSDIMMVLDQCVRSTSERPEVEAAVTLTFDWAKRSLAARGGSEQALFGIVQGGCFFDLRKRSAEQIVSLPFEGYAIGGLAVGEEIDKRNEVIDYTIEFLPVSHARYLMGVGTPLDLLEAVNRGVDMFDCILPTALAQQGVCFTSKGKIDLRRGVYKKSEEPLDPACSCIACQRYSRAYLHHLTKIGEFQGGTLLGIHNLTYYRDLMLGMREAICKDSFEEFYRTRKEILQCSDLDNPSIRPIKRPPRIPEEIGNYRLHRRGNIVSIGQISSGEVMHSVSDPLEEARRLYIEQAGIDKRLSEPIEEPLIIWDVGLGAATNAMGLVLEFERLKKEGHQRRGLSIISFENDLDSLKLALNYPNFFHHLRHPAPQAILKTHHWSAAQLPISWDLQFGDFLERMTAAPSPDFIFYDPFSYKVDSPLWTLSCFNKVFSASKLGTKLFTYSASTAVRAALLAAGFFVARGVSTGPKQETSIAIKSTLLKIKVDHLAPLLGAEWLSRWEKSDAQFPADVKLENKTEIESLIRKHPQFMSGQFSPQE